MSAARRGLVVAAGAALALAACPNPRVHECTVSCEVDGGEDAGIDEDAGNGNDDAGRLPRPPSRSLVDAGSLCYHPHWCALDDRPVNVLALWGAEVNDVWANSSDGLLFFDGQRWRSVPLPAPARINVVGGSAWNDVWAAGNNTIKHYDGARWSSLIVADNLGGLAVYSNDEAWAFGTQVWHYAADAGWSPVAGTGVSPYVNPISVAAVGRDSALMVFGTAVQSVQLYTAGRWSEELGLRNKTVRGVYVHGPDAWAASDTLLRGTWNSARTGFTWTSVLNQPIQKGVSTGQGHFVLTISGALYDVSRTTPVEIPVVGSYPQLWRAGTDVWLTNGTSVLRYDGVTLAEQARPTVLPIAAGVAVGGEAWATTIGGPLYRLVQGRLQVESFAPTGQQSLAARRADDVWLSGQAGVFHFDGVRWENPWPVPLAQVVVLTDGTVLGVNGNTVFTLSPDGGGVAGSSAAFPAQNGLLALADGGALLATSLGLLSHAGRDFVRANSSTVALVALAQQSSGTVTLFTSMAAAEVDPSQPATPLVFTPTAQRISGRAIRREDELLAIGNSGGTPGVVHWTSGSPTTFDMLLSPAGATAAATALWPSADGKGAYLAVTGGVLLQYVP